VASIAVAGRYPGAVARPSALVAIACAVPLASCASTPEAPPSLRRAIWVTRFEYRTAADIENIMANCKSAGFSAVMFQVRGNGTALYGSGLEVWSEQFDFQSPGFDPLRAATESARKHGLELHAWVNLMPGWRGDPARADARQLVRSRPGWFLTRDGGEPRPLESDYYWLNPCLPDVRRYLASLCFEIAANYRVDGIHLDYIRFPDIPAAERARYPGDPRSRSLFSAEHGAEPEARPEAFAKWRATCVTRLVEDIRTAVQTTAHRPRLTAAVWRHPDEAPTRLAQDWSTWTRARLIDAVLPMNYDDDDATFREVAAAAVAAGHSVPVVVGLGVYQHSDPKQTLRQMEAAFAVGASGVAMFSYSQIFGDRDLAQQERSLTFRRALGDWMSERR
jgi:uncharacterized lipoprotein YddW (UPF0748 family)